MSGPGPFARLAALYRQQGYAPVPVRPGSKAPCLPGWSRWCAELPPPALVRSWIDRYPGAGLAVALGPASGIVALDLDHDLDGLHTRILSVTGPSPIGKRGAKGPTYFYRHGGERSRSFTRGGLSVAEVLATGRLAVVPPTLHPDTGQPYEWLTALTLLDCNPSSLPCLAAAAVAALFEMPCRPSRRKIDHGNSDAAILVEALRYIPADDYHVWVQVGMALKAALDEAGFALWDNWSASSSVYDTRQMLAKWRSFTGKGITAGTLLHLARAGGYRPATEASPRDHDSPSLPGS
jgi:hypothetical protein